MKRRKKGAALVYALGVILMVSFVLFGLIKLVTSRVSYVSDFVAKEKSFQIVESCVNEYRWYLAHNTDGKTSEEVLDFWLNSSGETATIPRGTETDGESNLIGYSWTINGSAGTENYGHCNVKLEQYPTINTSTPVIALFEGYQTGENNKKRKIKVRFRRSSWSDYVILTNKASRFDTGWSISGKIMSNDGIEFNGVSSNRVYAAVSEYDVPGLGTKNGVWSSNAMVGDCEYNTLKSSCVFLGGKRYPMPKKDFEGIVIDFNAMKNSSQNPGGTTVNGCNYMGTKNCYFSNSGKAGRYIIFDAAGKTFSITNVKNYNSSSFAIKNTIGGISTYSVPEDGIIYVDDDLWLAGTIDNRVTIVAGNNNGTVAGNVYVGMGDLKYARKDGTNVIGLIAKGSVQYVLDKKICDGSCSTDLNLEIDAAMIAKDGTVGKPGFNEHCCGGGCALKKNRIDVYGSVISNEFIQFADSKECTGQGIKDIGFDIKNIVYDNNLYVNPPPFFPSDVYYTEDKWDEL